MKSKRPTQADIAQRAGVSRGTVSLVLNKTATAVKHLPKLGHRHLGFVAEPTKHYTQSYSSTTTRLKGNV